MPNKKVSSQKSVVKSNPVTASQPSAPALQHSKLQALILLDSSFKIRKFNQTADEFFISLAGKAIQLGTTFTELLPEEEAEILISDFTVAAQGHFFQTEREFIFADGNKRWISINYWPVELGINEATGVSLGMHDITDLKRTISELNATEHLVNSVFNAVSTGICITDENGLIADVNEHFCIIYQYNRDELIGQPFTMMLPTKQRQKMQQLHDEFIATGAALATDYEVITKHADVIKIAESADLLIQPDGKRFKVTSVRNISEQANLQQEQTQLVNTLKQRNSFIERVIAELPIGIAVNRITDGKATIVNNAFSEIYGWPDTDLTDINTFFEKVYPDEAYRQEVMSKIMDDIKSGDPKRMQWNNIMIVTKNGEKRYVNAKNIPLADQNLMISTVIDVTNEYISTTEIKESEARLVEAQVVAKVGSWENDLFTLSAKWSEETFRIFELDPALFELTYPAFIEYVHPEDKEKVNAAFLASFHDDSINHIEHRIITPTGRIKIVEERWKITRNKEGQPIKALGTCQDITGRKNAEEKIKEINQRYEYVTKATFDAIWDWDLVSGHILWSDAHNNLFGEVEQDGENEVERVKKRMHPTELEAVLESAARTLASADLNWEMEHRYLKADGTYAFVQNKAVILRNAKGKPLRVIGAMQDITIRKQKEQQLKLMESVITNTNDAVLITEAEPMQHPGHSILYVNDAFTRMTGYTAEEVIGKTPRILQGPKSERNELDRLAKAMQNWESCEITTINYKKNGEEFWNNMSISPVTDEKGWFTHWISIERDVTKQKMRELQKQLLAEISRLFNQDVGLKPTLEIILQNLLQYADINLGEAWLLSADKKSLNLIGYYTSDEQSQLFYKETADVKSFEFGRGLPGMVWKEEKMIMWDAAEIREKFVRKEAAKKAGFNAALGIPLLHNDEVVGVLVFMTAHDVQNLQQYKTLFTELEIFLGAELKRKHLEEELNQIFNTAPDIICLADFDGYFKRMNIAGCKLLGYSEEELFSKPADEFIHPDDRMISVDAVNSLAEGETIFYFENRYIKKDGSVIWLSWTCNSSVEDRLIYAVAKDITQNKELLELLNKANELARIGSWEIDLIAQKIYWSDVTRQIHEVDADFVPQLETGISFYKEGESRTKITALVHEAIENGESFDAELQLVTAKGNERWVRAIGSPEFSEGRCIRVYGSFQDIHERKSSAIAVLNALEEKNTILERISEAFVALDTNWCYTHMNKKAGEIFNRDPEKMIGKHIWTEFPEGLNQPFHLAYEKAMSTQQYMHVEEHYKPYELWFENHIYPSPNGLSIFFRDISERKRNEEKLRQSNERFEKVTEATNDAIWDYDLLKNTLFWGKGFFTLFGYDADEIKPSFELLVSFIHDEDRERIAAKVQQYIKDPTLNNWFEEYRFLKADGSFAFVIDRATFLRNNKGEVERVVGAMTDITYRKEFEESLRKLNVILDQRAKQLAVSNAELEQFAYIASHDLQEPLRMVTSFLTQVDKNYSSVLDEKGKKYIHFAVDGAKRMRQIILDLLEYSRIGRAGSNPEEVNLNELVDEIKFLFKRQIEEKEATILIDHLPVLHSHRSPLRQLFQNLIGNALKYSVEGKPVQIHIAVKETDTQYEFCITDNGIGIHEEYFEKIFIIFQRLHNQNEYSGTGMGLSISKKIVENLGGKIWVQSKAGDGSSFFFTIAKPVVR